jgi:hypothetical protein
VLLDSDLAALYGVETKVLLQAVRRNAERFPADFAFELSAAELGILRRQVGTSRSWGGRRLGGWRRPPLTERKLALAAALGMSAALRAPDI